MRTSQVSNSTSKNPISRKLVSLTTESGAPGTRNWSTASVSLPNPRADRTILMICTRYDSGNNAIFNWTLDGVAGIRLFALAPSNSSTMDIVAFPNRSSTSGIITAGGGVGSVTAHYSMSLIALYGFGLPTSSQTSGSTDTSASPDIRGFSLATGNTISCSGNIRRSPSVLFFAAVADFNNPAQPTSLPGLPTDAVVSAGVGQTIPILGTSYSWLHAFTDPTAARTSSLYNGSVAWSTSSRERQMAVVPIF